jgi:hypothetical protein
MQYIGIGELWNEKDTYTIIHIHGEITDIVAVSQHVCSFFASYPTGLQTITRSVAESSGMGKETTKSMMRTGTINTNDQKWVDELEKALKASPTPYDDYVTFVVLATERQQDFVQLIRQKFPKAHVEALTFDGLLTVALEKLRL